MYNSETQKTIEAPFGAWKGPDREAVIKTPFQQCVWMDCIDIMCLGPLIGLDGTAGASKLALFWLNMAFWVPLKVQEDPKRAPATQVTSLHLHLGSLEVLFAFLHMLDLDGSYWDPKMSFLAPNPYFGGPSFG